MGPDDTVRIQVWGRPDLSSDATVDAAGFMTLPLVGRVRGEGKTPTQLSNDLLSRYSILDPSITEVLVTAVQYNSRRITLVGEVRAPGRYVFQEMPDLWELILEAGGPTPSADLSRVQIVRKDPAPDEKTSLTVDLSRGIEGMDPARLPGLRPRDTVVVPSLAGETFSGTQVQVLGAVRSPGVFRLTVAESVVEALAASGGATAGADLSKVLLTRSAGGGAVVYELDVQKYLDTGHPFADLPLKAGDTITVPAGGGNLGTILGTVVRYIPLVTSVTSLIIALER